MDVTADPRAPLQYATAAQYLEMLLDIEHPEGVERQLSYAVQLYVARNDARVSYFASGGQPGRESKSSKWREADAAFWVSVNMLALLIDTHYPGPAGKPALTLVQQLIEHRAGPQCPGWPSKTGTHTVHDPSIECPVHSHKENPQWL